MPPRDHRRPYPTSGELSLGGAVTFAAVEAAASGATPRLRRFSMVAYTGGQMDLWGWSKPVVLDLAGMQAGKKSRPIYLSHWGGDIVGHTDEIRIGDSTVHVDGVVSGIGDAAREVVGAADNGFPWQSSVGARALRIEEVKAGETASANGRTFTGPVYIVRGSVLKEISFVPLGADDDTVARIAASQWGACAQVNPMSKTKTSKRALSASERSLLNVDAEATRLVAAGGSIGSDDVVAGAGAADDDDGDDVRAADEDPVEASEGSAGEDDPSDVVGRIRAATAAEYERIGRMREICATDPKIAAKAIRDGWDPDRAELEMLRAGRAKAPSAGVGPDRDASRGAIEASMLMASGMDEAQVGKLYDAKTMEAALSRDLRGMGFHGLMHRVCAAAGIHTKPGRVDDDTIRAAFTADRRLIEAGTAFSTFSMTGVLSNIANKRLRESFLSVPNYTLDLAEQVDTNDFKSFTTYQITGSGQFEKVGIDGTLKLASLAQDGWANQLETHGRIIAISRQHLINDDLGAFLKVVRILGRMAILGLNDAFFTLLLSNPGSPAFFSAADPPTGNANLISGGTSALSIGGLTLAEQKFLDQKDKDGKPIVLTPKTLVVPTSLKVVAEQLYTATHVNETTTANSPKLNSNPHGGKFKPLAVPYLNSQSIAGSSATAWYLFADPSEVPAAQVAYLNGQRTPIVESAETDFASLGMQFRGYWDIGIALQDPRAAVKSAGA